MYWFSALVVVVVLFFGQQAATLLNPYLLKPSSSEQQSVKYDPTWASLDTRPLPAWYDDVKVGIFVHWGVFSVPAFKSEWFWWDWKGPAPDPNVLNYMQKNYAPDFSYGDFAQDFSAKLFDPDEWADLFVRAGAKYVVLTSKHHEGYCMWNSSRCWQWNSVAVGPHRDLVGELAAAVQARTAKDGLHFGLYHSLFEWFNPLFQEDSDSNYTLNRFASEKTVPELYELVTKYLPEVVWSDGDWGAPDTYWNSTSFLAWLVNESPVRDTVVFNDRWGEGAMCTHGSFWTCEDRYDPGKLIPHKWENCMTLDQQSWGYRRSMNYTDVVPTADLVALMVRTVSCGGNILINVGPTQDGIIAPIFQERLLQLGDWLAVNGDAIYGTQPYTAQNDTFTGNVWYTQKKPASISAADGNQITVYATALNTNSSILFSNIIGATTITLGAMPAMNISDIVVLGKEQQKVMWKQSTDAPQGTDVMVPALDGMPSALQWGIVLQITLNN